MTLVGEYVKKSNDLKSKKVQVRANARFTYKRQWEGDRSYASIVKYDNFPPRLFPNLVRIDKKDPLVYVPKHKTVGDVVKDVPKPEDPEEPTRGRRDRTEWRRNPKEAGEPVLKRARHSSSTPQEADEGYTVRIFVCVRERNYA